MSGCRRAKRQSLLLVRKALFTLCVNLYCWYVKHSSHWLSICTAGMQWRIQDFPEEGAPTSRGGANIQFCQNFPKTAWNWKNLDPRGRAHLKFYYVDPPLVCKTLFTLTVNLYCWYVKPCSHWLSICTAGMWNLVHTDCQSVLLVNKAWFTLTVNLYCWYVTPWRNIKWLWHLRFFKSFWLQWWSMRIFFNPENYLKHSS